MDKNSGHNISKSFKAEKFKVKNFKSFEFLCNLKRLLNSMAAKCQTTRFQHYAWETKFDSLTLGA